jgi:hypothetical protein
MKNGLAREEGGIPDPWIIATGGALRKGSPGAKKKPPA